MMVEPPRTGMASPEAVGSTKDRVTFLSIGTHGDLFPSIALAQGLDAAGVPVTFATHERYEHLVRSRGFEFVAVGVEPEEIMRRGSNLDWGDWNPDRLEGPLEDFIEAAWAACRGSSCVLVSPMALAGCHVAEALRVPSIVLNVQPSTPAVARLYRRTRSPFNAWLQRRMSTSLPDIDLLEAVANGRPAYLYGYSTTVLPEVPLHLRWQHRSVITGYWSLEASPGEDLPADLDAFLGGGERPVLVTFGSTIDRHPEELWNLVQGGLEESDSRAVVVSSWTGRAGLETNDRTFVIDHVSYPKLLSRIELAVHHAGAGTTAAVLGAGVPSVPVPCLFDQFLWADAIADLGAATSPIHRSFLTSTRLAASIEAVRANPRFRTRSREIALTLADEDGVVAAVQHVLCTIGS